MNKDLPNYQELSKAIKKNQKGPTQLKHRTNEVNNPNQQGH